MSEPTIKAITNIPGWEFGATGSGRITDSGAAYERIPIIYRAVQIVCDSVLQVPFVIMRGETEVEWPMPQELRHLLWQTTAGLLLYGGAYWLKLRNRVRVVGVQLLNPATVSVEMAGQRQDNGLPVPRFHQASTTGGALTFEVDEVVYFREWSPSDDLRPGPGPAEVALRDARLVHYISRFAESYFEKGAMPVTLMMTDGQPHESELKKAETFFKRAMSGVANAWRTLVLRGGWRIETLSPNVDSLAIPELEAHARQQIARAFGIPSTMLEDAANYATAAQHDLQFWRNTIVPRAEMLGRVINAQLLEPMGLRIEFHPQELDVFQEDESRRAASLGALTGAGVPLALALELLGYDMPGGMEVSEALALAAPAALPAPAPVDVTPADAPARAELRAWERYARKRAGKEAREFEAVETPPVLAAAIAGALEVTGDGEAVPALFADALSWEGYP